MRHAKDVYYTLLGEFIEGAGVPGVENLFAPGSLCDENYARMLDAYGRLRSNLNCGDEDQDAETIIQALLENQRIVGLKMYEYGSKKSRS